MSPRIAVLVLAGAVLAGCVSTRTAPVADTRAAEWRGKSVVLTQRPTTDFIAMTAGKAAFAVVGVVAMLEAGKKIVEENGIEDPSPRLARDLLAAAQAQYGVTPASISPVQAGSTTVDPAKLVDGAAGADLVFDIQGMGGQFRYLPLHWGSYVVDSGYKFRVIEVAGAKVVAEGFCHQQGDSKNAVSKDELLADHAARLKQILDSERQACFEELKQKVLGIHG
jgi:hypothetical protein